MYIMWFCEWNLEAVMIFFFFFFADCSLVSRMYVSCAKVIFHHVEDV